MEAEELAGLQNNKNWKKSLLTTYQVCGGGGAAVRACHQHLWRSIRGVCLALALITQCASLAHYRIPRARRRQCLILTVLCADCTSPTAICTACVCLVFCLHSQGSTMKIKDYLVLIGADPSSGPVPPAMVAVFNAVHPLLLPPRPPLFPQRLPEGSVPPLDAVQHILGAVEADSDLTAAAMAAATVTLLPPVTWPVSAPVAGAVFAPGAARALPGESLLVTAPTGGILRPHTHSHYSAATHPLYQHATLLHSPSPLLVSLQMACLNRFPSPATTASSMVPSTCAST